MRRDAPSADSGPLDRGDCFTRDMIILRLSIFKEKRRSALQTPTLGSQPARPASRAPYSFYSQKPGRPRRNKLRGMAPARTRIAMEGMGPNLLSSCPQPFSIQIEAAKKAHGTHGPDPQEPVPASSPSSAAVSNLQFLRLPVSDLRPSLPPPTYI